MKYLLLILTTLSASAQLAITTFTIDHSPYGNLVLGWTNANPSYPLLILATPDLKQPSTNWTLLFSNSAPFSYGFAEWNYSTYYERPNTFVGLHDRFYTVSTNYIIGGTNMVITSSDPISPDDPYVTYTTNYVFQLASTNYTTNYNCFFKLYQPIPPPVSVNQAKPFECFTAGLFLSKVIFRLRI